MAGDDKKDLFEGFNLEIEPEKIDEAIRTLRDRARTAVEQSRYTKVRIKYRGKPLMGDIPLGVFVATEALTFWYGGLIRALMVNLGVRTILEVEFVHDADAELAKGLVAYQAGDVEEAEACYRSALEMRPDHPSTLVHLGVLLRVTGRRKEAMEALEKAAEDAESPDGIKAAEILTKMARGPRTL